VLAPFTPANPQERYFNPKRAAAERGDLKGGASNFAGSEGKGKGRARRPTNGYNHHAVAMAVERACKKAKVPHWHPNQLRHLFATKVRHMDGGGLEAAQVLLGHSCADVTQVYAEKNLALATKVAAEIG
jgi:integrase